MVVIINGEIVPDNDPRAVARRGSAAGTGTAAPASGLNQRGGARVMSFGDLGGNGGRRPSTQQPAGGPGNGDGGAADDVDGMLTPLSKLMGIAGRRVDVPPVPQIKFTGYSFPLVHLVVAVLVMLFTGSWRYGVLAFIALAMFNVR